MLLYLAAAGFPIVVLQLVIYPFMADSLNKHDYGLMIAIYSMLLLFSDSFGRSVNNERLINSNEKKNKQGDYNQIVILFQFINIIIITIGSFYYVGNDEYLSITIIIVTAMFMLFNAYLIVQFRIMLNYVAIVINAAFMCVGFGIGFLIYKITGLWEIVFLFGQMLPFVYLVYFTKLLREPFIRTERFGSIFKDSSFLAASLLLAQGMNLADKLVLFPLLGGATLSIYYTASLVGKLLTVATGPVNSVILSYLAKKESLSVKLFKKYVLICLTFCIVLSVMILILSRPVLGLLFPKFVDEAMVLVPYTTAGIFFYVMASMITPIVMRYCAAAWQTIINGVSFAIYILGSIVLLQLFDVIGFCIGIAFSHLIRFVILIAVYYNNTDKNNNIKINTDSERGNNHVSI